MDALAASQRIYEHLVRSSAVSPPQMRTWTGETWGPADAAATIVLRHAGSLRALLATPNDLSAGEAYVYDDLDVEGSMTALMEFGASIGLDHAGILQRLNLLRFLRRLPTGYLRERATRPRLEGRLHSIVRDRQAVTHHYDVGNDFFAAFLDPHMVYSCAHFLDPTESLEKAQVRKLDTICRKLSLLPGQRFLDVGCGWGALVVHAAANYGVEATGITVSGAQAELARERARQMGVEERVRILQGDYRDLDGKYDAVASVGMFEHVGRAKLPAYFRRLRKLLTHGGQVLNHGIVTRDPPKPLPWLSRPSFVETYVFPDKDLLPVAQSIAIAEEAGFELRDAENLRMSYAATLRNWVHNLEANATVARSESDEQTFRIWRLYMAGSVVAFERAAIAVWQLLLADPARPWTYGRKRLLAVDDL